MKKTDISLFFLCLSALVSCQATHPEIQESVSGSPSTFSASVENRKTELAGTASVYWSPSDRIALFAGAGKEAGIYTTSIKQSSARADFEGSGAVTLDGRYIAVYPAESSPSFGEASVGLNMKSVQSATVGSFDPEAALMMAESESTNLSFKHLVSYLSFIVGEDSPELKTLEVRSISGSALSGRVEVSYSDMSLTPVSASDKVRMEAPGKFAEGRHCIALLPGEYSDGLEFNFTTVDGEIITRTLPGPVSLQNGDMMDMGEIILPATEYPSLKTMYFNIRTSYSQTDIDLGRGWDVRKPGMFAMMREQMPDVAGLSEVRDNQRIDIEQELAEYSLLQGARDDYDGNYIIYNPLKVEPVSGTAGKFWLSPTPDYESTGWSGASDRPRTCIYSRFKFKDSDKTFWIFLTHTASEDVYDCYKGLELIEARIASIVPEGEPVLLGGDMNCRPLSGPVTVLKSSLADVRECSLESDSKPTYNNWGESSAILDFIYARGKLSLHCFRTIDKGYAGIRYISDHYPVLAEVRIGTPYPLDIPAPVILEDVFSSNVPFESGSIGGSVAEQTCYVYGKDYPCLKIGTAEKDGSFSFSPSVTGDFDLSLFAYCWGSADSELKVSVSGGYVNGKSIEKVRPRSNNDCSSRISVFNPFASDKYVFRMTGISAGSRIKISVSKPAEPKEGKKAEFRTIVFGINCTGGEPRPVDDGSAVTPLTPQDEWQEIFN